MLTDTISTDGKSSTTDISSTRRKILIVDDDIDLTSMFKMVLEMNGFEVDTYNDPLLALQLLSRVNVYNMMRTLSPTLTAWHCSILECRN
jgi:PleD family two-component response regulator